jgi:hexosaminidase
MYQTLNRRSGLYFKQRYISSKNNSDTASLQVTVDKSVPPSPGADESYSLSITNNRVNLKAPTTLGALHGLETILQLLTKDKNGEFYFPVISDPGCSPLFVAWINDRCVKTFYPR